MVDSDTIHALIARDFISTVVLHSFYGERQSFSNDNNVTVSNLNHIKDVYTRGAKNASQVRQSGIRGRRPRSVEQPASRHPASGHLTPSLPSRTVSRHICLNCHTASRSDHLFDVDRRLCIVTHAMLRRLTSRRCIIIIIIIIIIIRILVMTV